MAWSVSGQLNSFVSYVNTSDFAFYVLAYIDVKMYLYQHSLQQFSLNVAMHSVLHYFDDKME